MSTRSILHQARLNEWATRFADQKASGLSVSEWCKQNNQSRHKFFYWKRLLKEEVTLQALPEIVPLSISSAQTQSLRPQISTAFEAACESRASCATFTHNPCARVLFGDIIIELDSSASETFLTSLIKAVRHA